METSLHRQLKQQYACDTATQEVKVGAFRIDVVNPDCLVEIQHGSLAAIRDKTARLLADHRVLVPEARLLVRELADAQLSLVELAAHDLELGLRVLELLRDLADRPGELGAVALPLRVPLDPGLGDPPQVDAAGRGAEQEHHEDGQKRPATTA